jgi:prepilin-type N-terminal cleavage/methylation domain-containing protein
MQKSQVRYFKRRSRERGILNLSKSGFTLIEVLLSLVLFTILLGTVYSSFFTIQRALDRFDGVSLKYHEVRSALDVMRREVESAFLYQSPFLASGKKQTAFVMKDRDIFSKSASVMSLTAFTFTGSGTKSVSYYVEEKNKVLVLMKAESPPLFLTIKNPVEPSLKEKGYALEMIEGIEGFSVEVFFNNKWIKTWDSHETGKLPEVVRFTIEFDDRGRRVRLSEYARPQIGTQL